MAKEAAAPVFGADYTADYGMAAVTRVQARPVLSAEWATAALFHFAMSTLDELKAGGPALLRHELDWAVLDHGMHAVVTAVQADEDAPVSRPAAEVEFLAWLRVAVAELLELEAAGGPLPGVWRVASGEPGPDFRGEQDYPLAVASASSDDAAGAAA